MSGDVKVLMLAVSDLRGGAHRAAFRLHRALRRNGVQSTFAVREKASADGDVYQLSRIEAGWPNRGQGLFDRVPRAFLTRRDEPISLGLRSAKLGRLVERFRPDVVHLHWVNGGMASIEAVGNLTAPLVWTMHDMWTFTGGCHYAGECQGFLTTCTACPKVRSFPLVCRAPAWVLARKKHAWRQRPWHAIAPSRWMASMARQSSLFRDAAIETIGYCVDPSVFNPSRRMITRQELGLTEENRCVLFVNADQPRKGAVIISDMLRHLKTLERWKNARFLFAGGMPPGVSEGDAQVLRLPATHDEGVMAGYYAASDVYALPSYEDNLPNVIIESLACGTPVVAFPSGGIREMIQTGENGLLTGESGAASMNEALAELPGRVFQSRGEISANAHMRYDEAAVAEAHRKVYVSAIEATAARAPQADSRGGT